MNRMTPDETAAWLAMDGRVHVIAYVNRAAVLSFMAAVEWYWYQPNTPRNRLFDIHACTWNDAGFLIMAFPEGRMDAVTRLAKQLGLKLVSGVPAFLGAAPLAAMITIKASHQFVKNIQADGGLISLFPGATKDGKDNQTLYTVEYDNGSPLYKNKKNDEKAMHAADEEVNKMLNNGIRLTPFQIADYIYGTGSFPNVPRAEMETIIP